MITGWVTAKREATIRLTVRGPTDREQTVEAVVDTGFNGWISLPPSVVSQLGLTWCRRGRAVLADGSEVVFEIYEATALWDGRQRRVPVDEADAGPLVGMSLLEGYTLTVQVRDGGGASIGPLQ